MTTNDESPPLVTEDGHRRRSARRRVPKTEWQGHEDRTSGTTEDGTQDVRLLSSRPSNNKGFSKGSTSISKTTERKKKIADGFKGSSHRENGEKVKRSSDKGKNGSKTMMTSVDSKSGFTIPPAIFNDIPDIDLCPLKETATTNTRKRHNRQTSLVSPPIKLRKMMKHSDGCSSNSGSGSETSITDGMEPSLGLPTEETTRIRCSRKHKRTSSPREVVREYSSSTTAVVPNGLDSKPPLEFSYTKRDLKSWEEDFGPNSTAPPILWARDNIPEKLNESKEWISLVEDILLKWNSLPRSTKLVYMNKASKSQFAKISPSLENQSVYNNDTPTTSISIDSGTIPMTVVSTNDCPAINKHIRKDIHTPAPLEEVTTSNNTTVQTGATPSTSTCHSSNSISNSVPVGVVTPPFTSGSGSMYNLPMPLLAATLMANNLRLPQPPVNGVIIDSSSSIPIPPTGVNAVIPFPTSLPISSPSSTSVGNVVETAVPFSNALKLLASMPFTMNDSTSTGIVVNSAVPIMKVENPVCSPDDDSLNHLLTQPLQNITGPPHIITGPFHNIVTTPKTVDNSTSLTTHATETSHSVTGTPQSALMLSQKIIDTISPNGISSTSPVIPTYQNSLQTVNSNFCINNILGGRSMPLPATLPLEATPTIPTSLPIKSSSDVLNVQSVIKPPRKKKRWSQYRIMENSTSVSVCASLKQKATVVSCITSTSTSPQVQSNSINTATNTCAITPSFTSSSISIAGCYSVGSSPRSPTSLSTLSSDTIIGEKSSSAFAQKFANVKTTSSALNTITSGNDLSVVSDDWKRALERHLREKNETKPSNDLFTVSHKDNSRAQIPKKKKRLKSCKNSSFSGCYPMAASSPTTLLGSPSMVNHHEHQSFVSKTYDSPASTPRGTPRLHQQHSSLGAQRSSSRSSSCTSLTSPVHNMPLFPPPPTATGNNYPPFRSPITCNNTLLRGLSSPMNPLASPVAVPGVTPTTPNPMFPNSILSPEEFFNGNFRLFDPMAAECKGMNLTPEEQAKFDALNYANLERQYWRLLIALEEQKKSIANMKERMMKARIEQQMHLLKDEKFNHLKELVVNPVMDPIVPDLLDSPLKDSTVTAPTSEIRLKGTFDKPVLENEDIYKYLLQSLS